MCNWPNWGQEGRFPICFNPLPAGQGIISSWVTQQLVVWFDVSNLFQEANNQLPCGPLSGGYNKKTSPIGSMYGIFTHIWHKFMVNVGKYTIHGSYGSWVTPSVRFIKPF